jgi:hypothetical protein
VAHGEVVATEQGNGQDRIQLRTELVAERSMWIAVRAFGARELLAQGQVRSHAAVAHTAPIYVVVDGQPFWNPGTVAQRVKEQKQHLQDLLAAPVDPMGDLEAWETVDVLARQWERQRNQLRARVEEADAKYNDILKRATGQLPTSGRGYSTPGLMAAVAVGLLFLRVRGRGGWS